MPVFEDKSCNPDHRSLKKALGASTACWDDIVGYLETRAGLAQEWKYYGQKYGWQLKVAVKKRALVYLIPGQGRFTAALALSDEAAKGLRASGLPAKLVTEIESAKRYPEGRPARIEVSGDTERDLVRRLLDIKLASL